MLFVIARRNDEAIYKTSLNPGLLRYARNDAKRQQVNTTIKQ